MDGCPMSEQAPMKPAGTKPKSEAVRSPEEQEIISALERSRGRPLTEQEAWLALEQARAIGVL